MALRRICTRVLAKMVPAPPYRVRSFLPCQAIHVSKVPPRLKMGRFQGALLFPRFSSAVFGDRHGPHPKALTVNVNPEPEVPDAQVIRALRTAHHPRTSYRLRVPALPCAACLPSQKSTAFSNIGKCMIREGPRNSSFQSFRVLSRLPGPRPRKVNRCQSDKLRHLF
ncbi:hypothetical protein BDP81DRAFT_121558 [Colletotrichum phormii]|uniref:Uncharacterized protein n=1 Tax=Colletotrichum phormii TaxID=359342 RepID=A0AAI9ZF47_9PEZI|nr:uncharacterized protein BDP81DRAFT_121558 [Colletotrichum phormii]KAK1623390.1 hypothetical protein BDP81DRAFT_121558 [Colletotrichum phormii]